MRRYQSILANILLLLTTVNLVGTLGTQLWWYIEHLLKIFSLNSFCDLRINSNIKFLMMRIKFCFTFDDKKLKQNREKFSTYCEQDSRNKSLQLQLLKYRSMRHSQVFSKIDVLQNFEIFIRKHLQLSSFTVKLQKRLNVRCFPDWFVLKKIIKLYKVSVQQCSKISFMRNAL